MRGLPESSGSVFLFLALALVVPPVCGCGGGGGGGEEEAPVVAGPPLSLTFADHRLNTTPAPVDEDGMRIACSGDTVYAVWSDERDGDMVVYFSRSRDGGRSWLDVDVRISDVTGRPSEKAALACDGENVYVVWEDGRDGQANIWFSGSADGGDTWSPNRRIQTNAAGVEAARQPRICCAGLVVCVGWKDNRGVRAIHVNRSLDGGATWLATDRLLHPEYTEFELCCDGTHVYAVIEDGLVRNDIVFRRSADGGVTWTPGVRLDQDSILGGLSWTARICCDGDRVYVVWRDAGAGAGDDIYFNASHDAGTTWLPAQVRLDTDAPRTGDSVRPRICCDGDRVYVVWEDFRAGRDEIRFNRSLDGGLTWLDQDVRIDRARPGDDPLICCEGARVYVAWYAYGTDAIAFNYSLDGGDTWLDTEMRLDTIPAGGASIEMGDMCCGAGAVHVVWRDDRDGDPAAWVRSGMTR